jgi:dTDP-4-dehydrorhamnose 3,5-epimerase
MQLIETPLHGAYIIEQTLYQDPRGSFLEIYSSSVFAAKGLNLEFVQDNCSHSLSAGVIRGLHFQRSPHAQAKLVWVLTGKIFDVIVDLRDTSSTYLKWTAFELSAEKPRMLFVPKGFAHGFCTLVPDTRVFYKVDTFYSPQSESGIRWDDPDLAISWPTQSPLLSDKDKVLPMIKELDLRG